MDSIIVKGGVSLKGEIDISGSKNASLPIMAASLLTSDSLKLSNVPDLSDIVMMKSLLNHHGTKITSVKTLNQGSSIELNSEEITCYTAPYEIVRKMRASIWILGPLLARFGQAKVSLPGGCAIGTRQVDMHIAAMEALGANIVIKDGYICASSNGRLKSCTFKFSKCSVGATINVILAAVLADGESHFFNCAREPEIVDLCSCLNKMGAEIYGIGTSEIRIIGKKSLNGTKHNIMPDRIEAGTYMLATAATRGKVRLKGINSSIVESLIDCMIKSGTNIECGENYIDIMHEGIIKPVDISTAVYPGFPTDLQAQFMSFMTIADGVSNIFETIFENRFMHVPEMCRMGANITVNKDKAIVTGVKKLTAAEVMASDLRASVSLIISGLCAEGYTKVRRVYHLDRGYESLEKKLANCGAEIERISGDLL